jgi:hypothetical protein
MLKWINQQLGNPDRGRHPLASQRGIDGVLASVPFGNSQHALQAIDTWLGELAEQPGLLDNASLAHAVLQLDSAVRGAVCEIWQAFQQEAAANPVVQLDGLDSYFAHLSALCDHVLQVELQREIKTVDAKSQVLLAARGLRAKSRRKLIGHFSYQLPSQFWWQSALETVALARLLGVQHNKVSVYDDDANPGSPWREFVCGMLFELAPLTNFDTPQMLATDLLMRWIEPQIAFSDTPSDDQPFLIVLDQALPPLRRQPGLQIDSDNCRHFGLARAYTQIVQLRSGIESSQQQPLWLALSGCSLPSTLQLLQMLIGHWSPTPPRRRNDRFQQQGTLFVVQGLALARRMIAASEFAHSGRDLDYDSYLKDVRQRLFQHEGMAVEAPPAPKTPLEVLQLLETAGDRQMMEQWELLDFSISGIGARTAARRPWLSIGALVGYRVEDALDWRVAIVRRIGRVQGRVQVGMSSFVDMPRCSQIRFPDQPINADAWAQQTREASGLSFIDAILISEKLGLIMIPSGYFVAERIFQLSRAGRWHSARMSSLHASGTDYQLIAFRKQEN